MFEYFRWDKFFVGHKSQESIMIRFPFFCALTMALLLSISCSGGNPVDTDTAPFTNQKSTSNSPSTNKQLWGLYTVYIDIVNQTAEATLNRSAMFTANVTQFINNNPLFLIFEIIDTPVGPDYIDVDINVGIVHPFAGLDQYNGYDAFGVLMEDSSSTLTHNTKAHNIGWNTLADIGMIDDPDHR